MTYALYGILATLVLLATLQWKIYCEVSGHERLRRGDIVMYVNPGENDPRNNMITEVLEDHGDYASIRTLGNSLVGSTTGGARKKFLTRLPVDRNHPILTPGEPTPSGFTPTGFTDNNGARWTQIPLDWFQYTIPNTKREKNIEESRKRYAEYFGGPLPKPEQV